MTFAFLVLFQIFLSGFSGQRLEKLRRVINLGGGIRWVEYQNLKLISNINEYFVDVKNDVDFAKIPNFWRSNMFESKILLCLTFNAITNTGPQ